MTDPFDAAAAAGHQLQTQLADKTAKEQADQATIAALSAQVAQLQAQAAANPAIRWGVNGSDQATVTRRANAVGGIQVVRYFNQTGEGIDPSNIDRSGIDLVYSPQGILLEQLAGKWDTAWLTMLRKQPTNRVTYVTAQHEPESHVGNKEYAPADYCAAMRRLAGLARQVGPHIKVTSILMGWTVNPKSGRNVLDYWPGDDVIDVAAWDPYQEGATFDPAVYQLCLDFATAHGKPWAIAETGSNSTKVSGQARQGVLKAMSGFCAGLPPEKRPLFVCYFDNGPYTISNDPGMVAAWKAGQTTA